MGDVDGDDDLDLIAVAGSLHRFRNNSLGLFQTVGAPLVEPSGFDVVCGYVDDDEFEDVVWSDDGWTTVYRGSLAFDLPEVQYETYGSEFPVLADVVSGSGLDLLGVGSGETPEIAAWPGLLVPTSVPAEVDPQMDRWLLVAPTVSSGEPMRIELSNGASSLDRTLGVFDAQGREVTRVKLGLPTADGAMGFWDGRDGQGTEVPTGAYWVRGETEHGFASARVIFVR